MKVEFQTTAVTMLSPRGALIFVVFSLLLFLIFHNSNVLEGTSLNSLKKDVLRPNSQGTLHESGSQKLSLQRNGSVRASKYSQNYFGQVFSLEKPSEYDFPALAQQCERTKWPDDEVFINCKNMAAGLTTIMSQVKVCLKMAVEAGTGLILPSMPLRDSTNLQEFNFLNEDAHMTYDKWFDADHLITSMARVCPKMKIIHPETLGSETVPVKHRWSMALDNAPKFVPFYSYFWSGRSFKAFFEKQYRALEDLASMAPNRDDTKKGITIIDISSQFLLFRITDDPTGHDLRLWNDLAHLVRFRDEPRKIISKLLKEMKRPFYGVHFRAEADTIWSSPDNQMNVDLDALDLAFTTFGDASQPKPLVYLACGDQNQVQKFSLAGQERGWEVVHKWSLAATDQEALNMINELAFDFQGAVDMGVMVKSEFFLGIIGSAFSSTVGNARDGTGRYRGSSFEVWEDGGARTHLFNDGDAAAYACCL